MILRLFLKCMYLCGESLEIYLHNHNEKAVRKKDKHTKKNERSVQTIIHRKDCEHTKISEYFTLYL